jgi:hypothetical protein
MRGIMTDKVCVCLFDLRGVVNHIVCCLYKIRIKIIMNSLVAYRFVLFHLLFYMYYCVLFFLYLLLSHC